MKYLNRDIAGSALAIAILLPNGHALVNNTCPATSGSPNGSTQQIITPLQWSDSDWHTEIGDLVKVLVDWVPAMGPIGTAMDVVDLLWQTTDNTILENTINMIMKAVYSLVQTEIDADVLSEINSYLKTAHDKIYEYQESGGPDNLDNAETFTMQAYNRMITYTDDTPSHIFLPSLLFTASLHLSIRRTAYYDYDATDPAWASYIENVESFNEQTKDYYYAEYYSTFLSWVPEWANWRKGELHTSTDADKEDQWTVKDEWTGQTCKATTANSGLMNAFKSGTDTAIENEYIGNMLSTLQPFSGIHRLVPGWENNNTLYPASDASWPLGLYREGIPYGPYAAVPTTYIAGVTASDVFTCGQSKVSGWYYQQDNQGNITDINIYAYPNSNGWLTSVDMTYDYGSGTGGSGHGIHYADSTNVGNYKVNDILEDGYVTWIATKYFGNAPDHYNLPISKIAFGFGNPSGKIASKPFVGGANGSHLANMTLGSHFAVSAWGQQECNCNSYAMATTEAWFLPTDIYVGNATDLPTVAPAAEPVVFAVDTASSAYGGSRKLRGRAA